MLEFAEYGYLGLFLASFLAATVLPFSSEVVLSALIVSGLDAWLCVLWATIGNWFGGLTCYWLGHLGKMEWIEKWLRISPEKVARFKIKVKRYGGWIAALTFLPGIGDVIAVACGFVRCRLWIVALSMLIGKLLRYIVWMYLSGLLL